MLKHCLAFKTCEPSIQSPVEVSISCQDNESSRLWSPSDFDNEDGDGDWAFAIGDWWLVLYLILSSHTITCREGGKLCKHCKGGWRKRGWSNAYDFVYVPCQQYSFNRTILHILLYTYLHQGIQCPLGIIYISCKRIIRGRMWEKQPRWKFQKAIL